LGIGADPKLSSLSANYDLEYAASVNPEGCLRLTRVSVKNFKGLRDVVVPLSRFVCIIGENNAGKSSLLQALLLFVEGRKLEPSMYFDPSEAIVITVRIEDVSDLDLALIANEEHRKRVEGILRDSSATLVRRYDTDGSSRLRWLARVPVDPRFDEDAIDTLVKGKRAGSTFATEVTGVFPELKDSIDSKTTQARARELIDDLAASTPVDQTCEKERDLPAGIDNAIRGFLPEPIYIAAVKDLADEIATKDSASFGKLLGVVLAQISPELEGAGRTFEFLKRNLNRVEQEDGSILDNRLEAVRNIETLIQTRVRENFPAVEIDIRIPPPEIKTVLAGAQIWVDDGVKGLIETKGDGLRRTVTFSILRAYVELRRLQKHSQQAEPLSSNYLFLFEEPELYLHPSAQAALFDALAEISQLNHVVVSTHSPMFLGADATGTFIKLEKIHDSTKAIKPFAKALYVDLGSLDDKTRFQIISYETNNTAFFSDTVVLVEGDSELIVLPHVARVLNSDWTPEKTGVAFCRVGGKGNISRYREFFEAFDVRVCVVADLDCLAEGFDKLGCSDDCKDVRQQLLKALDDYADNHEVEGKLTSSEIRDMQESRSRQNRFKALKNTLRNYKAGTCTIADVDRAEEEFFVEQITSRRRQVLRESNDEGVLQLKQELLRKMRAEGVFVLHRGEIEDYYPPQVGGPDKPSKAIDFCNRVRSRDELLQLSDVIELGADGSPRREFQVLLESIYGDVGPIQSIREGVGAPAADNCPESGLSGSLGSPDVAP
jgi:putative ATP-dependent endonuclease of the OLD family